MIEVPTQIEDENFLPLYATHGAAGADVKAAIKEPLIITPGERSLIPTGIKVAVPEGYEIQVRPRSGLALKHGIALVNSPGTIDADYRGEIGVIMINLSATPFEVLPGMRIAQLVLAPVLQAKFVQVESLTETARGAQGFGHTGKH